MVTLWTAPDLRHLVGLAALLFTTATMCSGQAIPTRPLAPLCPRPAVVVLGGLTVSTSATTLSFNLAPGSTSDTPSTVLTTSWTALAVGTIALDVYGYLSSPSVALQNSSNAAYVVPSSAVSGMASGAGSLVTSLTPFTQTTPTPAASNAGLHIVSGSVNILVLGAGSRTNTISMQVNLNAQPQLPAGTYTGTLTLIAVAN